MPTLDSFLNGDLSESKPGVAFEDRIRHLTEGGTFKDSRKMPVHRWFYYPTGFSVRLVFAAFSSFSIGKEDVVLDPFVGSGTTCICAQLLGINSIGIEAHPFVFQMAKAKINWDLDQKIVQSAVRSFLNELQIRMSENQESLYPLESVPELLRKLYSDKALQNLLIARELVDDLQNEEFFLFFKVALATALRKVSQADTGWPYMLPKKKKTRERSPLDVLRELLNVQLEDLVYIQEKARKGGETTLVQGDARDLSLIEDESINVAFTSPPYLNNFDYADRTRMETYFFGEANSWGEITAKVRSKLIISATTQIRRGEWDPENILDPRISEEVQERIYASIRELSQRRLKKGGRKSYDILVGGYFSDMCQNLAETYRVLKKKTKYLLVLGDSAPYGVYVPTEEYLGKIGEAVGFSSFKLLNLRQRGNKWKSAPKHSVPLRESILVLEK
ncbi:MAG: DNA methyltransferase [Candidatus Heimdallarchaeota archaeon]